MAKEEFFMLFDATQVDLSGTCASDGAAVDAAKTQARMQRFGAEYQAHSLDTLAKTAGLEKAEVETLFSAGVIKPVGPGAEEGVYVYHTADIAAVVALAKARGARKDFARAVAQEMKLDCKLSKGEAISLCVKKFPASYQQWLRAGDTSTL